MTIHEGFKGKRGTVEHVVFDPNSEKQMADLKELVKLSEQESYGKERAKEEYKKTMERYLKSLRDTSTKIILQYKFNKPSGYIKITPSTLPTGMGTIITPTKKPEEKRVLAIQWIFVKPELRDKDKALKGKKPLRGRKQAYHLAAKMYRHIAKTYGLPLIGAPTTAKGASVAHKYRSKYDINFFKRRGSHKPRKGRR